MKKLIFFYLIGISFLYSDSFFYNNGKKEILKKEQSSSFFRSQNYMVFYGTSDNQVVGIKDEIMVSFKKEPNISNFLKKYNLTFIKEIIPQVFLLRVKEENPIDVANKIFENELNVKESIPNFYTKIQSR
ncbi:MAG: hypothetical protein OIF32_09755 [Campylobacterales bacterium]|nr:hypothetical protein [Campylobacterales bacterium]